MSKTSFLVWECDRCGEKISQPETNLSSPPGWTRCNIGPVYWDLCFECDHKFNAWVAGDEKRK